MTQEQIIHVGMINSFNLITERYTLDEIATSDVSYFAHVPNEDVPIDLIQLMISYFQSFEMYGHCADLMNCLNKNYNEDGTIIKNECKCAQPMITEYSKKMFCGKCKKRLMR